MRTIGLVVATTAEKTEKTCGVVITAPQETKSETVNDIKKHKGGRPRKN